MKYSKIEASNFTRSVLITDSWIDVPSKWTLDDTSEDGRRWFSGLRLINSYLRVKIKVHFLLSAEDMEFKDH